MAKDKRIKGCPNLTCKRYRKEYKYKPTDNFCTHCGTELVYVCADCFEKIEDRGPLVYRCSECEAKHEAKKEALKAGAGKAKELAGKGMKLAPAAVGLMKDPSVKGVIKSGVSLIKKKK